MNAIGRRLRRLVLGEAGPAPALVLAGVALVIVFIVTAGPRALTAADNRATRQAVAQAPKLDTAVQVAADMEARPGGGVLSARILDRLTSRFAAKLPAGGQFPAAMRWSGALLPELDRITVGQPPGGIPERIEVGYRSHLASHSALVAGALPKGPVVVGRSGAGKAPSVTLTVAFSKVAAATFAVKVGSVLNLGSAAPGTPVVLLKVTGIITPRGRASAFWQHDPELAVPEKTPGENPRWIGGGLVGPGELAGLAYAYKGQTELATWFFPMGARPTSADVHTIESGTSALAAGPQMRQIEVASGAAFLQHTVTSTGLADGLAVFTSQWHVTTGVDSVLVVGLFVVGLVLLLICCGLAAQAYRPELTIMRVRGGSIGQVARRTFARSCCIAVPALAIGWVVAVLLLPAGGTPVILAGMTAAVAVVATPLIAVLEHRTVRINAATLRADAPTRRSPVRRLVGELAVLLIAAAALADLRLRGAGQQAGGTTGTTGAYLSASAVLVAAAVALVLNRAYRGPLRLLAGVASIRRGAVGAVGLARAAASRAGTVLPALALMLGLTLTVFSAMVLASISNGQQNGSWEQVGADAVVSVHGTDSVPQHALSVIKRAPGVRHVTAMYTARSAGSSAAVLIAGNRGQPVALAAIDPRSYAAVAADTQWPALPAAHALARPADIATSGPLPILVTPGLAAQVAKAGGGALRLEDYGQFVTVRIAGTITATPAMPTGSQFVMVPRWATKRLTAVPPPSTALVTGPHLNITALRATVARVLPGGQILFRQRVVAELKASPALRLSEGLYIAGAVAAAAVSALAVLFSLATSARGRAPAMQIRLGALGMARSETLLLGMTEAVPLLAVAAVGTAACVWLLAVLVGPILGLNTFTGSLRPATLAPTWFDLIVPLAGVAVLAVGFLAIDGMLAGRRKLATALRQEEAA